MYRHRSYRQAQVHDVCEPRAETEAIWAGLFCEEDGREGNAALYADAASFRELCHSIHACGKCRHCSEAFEGLPACGCTIGIRCSRGRHGY